MKKLIVFALCAMTAVSAFAEAFSSSKLNQLISKKKYNQARQYAYESEISKQSNFDQARSALRYFLQEKKYAATKVEIENFVNKFKDYIKEYQKNILFGIGFTQCGLYDNAMQIASKNTSLQKSIKAAVFASVSKKRNKDLMWKYGKILLLIDGGLNSPKLATSTIQAMFRYKPASITKEQQVEFLTKIADIYPIPGTDFAEWKAFMGFVGFKYKALTGKDLF